MVIVITLDKHIMVLGTKGTKHFYQQDNVVFIPFLSPFILQEAHFFLFYNVHDLCISTGHSDMSIELVAILWCWVQTLFVLFFTRHCAVAKWLAHFPVIIRWKQSRRF